ncbi:MAG TPA: potassium transporter TrkG [Thermohalobaculum sp.]|nr:potassium transporter TrkG [Thermohalobaculum sp.]
MKLLRIPVFPLCLGVLALAMLGPALFGLIYRDWFSARSFLYCAIFTGFASATLAMALGARGRNDVARTELRDLVVCWLLVPLFAGAPLWLRTPYLGAWGAWFEMVSAFTTTGGTVYAEPERVPEAIHLWRGMVAWFGGLLTLVAAFAILAPRNLGGFEVVAHNSGVSRQPRTQSGGVLPGKSMAQGGRTAVWREASMARLDERLARTLRAVLPVYAALTAVLALLFSAMGQSGLAAAVHAMAIVSTSGVSPYANGLAANPSFPVELAAALFMVLAATRLTYVEARRSDTARHWYRDSELKLMALLVISASLALFLRHWFGALTIDLGDRVSEAPQAIWGVMFTSLSFLTTTGFQSASWEGALDWSGLANPGLILLGLCAIGGGAATTAGGIKLVRGYALLRHGYRELERIAQPNSVLATGTRLRGNLSEGAFLAWAFVMLYIMAIFVAVFALTFTGLTFENSLVAAIASISNTGPAFAMVTPGEIDFSRLSESQRVILAITMVLGRIETLAVISLFNTDTWQQFSIRTKNTGKLRGKPSVSTL